MKAYVDADGLQGPLSRDCHSIPSLGIDPWHVTSFILSGEHAVIVVMYAGLVVVLRWLRAVMSQVSRGALGNIAILARSLIAKI